tara:strand:- start:11126 stop:11770 length:645 start_codon:yes stop_codon:yes gene_type:complete
MFKYYLNLIFIFGLLQGQSFSIARVQYSGGGDWYSDPSSIPNLLNYLSLNTPMSVHPEEYRIKLTDQNLNQFPYLYLTGHGNIGFTNDEIIALRSHLMNGGFLHVDDNYGLDKSIRIEIKKLFPNKDLVPLPNNHKIFNSFYKIDSGLPKVHEHDNKPPQAFGIFNNDRLIILYTYESDLGDGWEDPTVHQNPWPIRQAALKMGVNIIYFALTQ